MKKVNNKKKKKNLSFMNYLVILLIVITLLTAGLIYFINILPLQYFVVFAAVLAISNFIICSLLLAKGKFQKVIGVLLSIIMIIIEIMGITYELNTLDFLKQFGFNNYKTENYNVIVLNDSKYNDINELDKKSIGHLKVNKKDGLEKFLSKLNNKISYKDVVKNDMDELINELIRSKVDAIILEDSQLEILEEENIVSYKKLKKIYSLEVSVEIKDISKDVNVTKDSFNIYISGIDTYGAITKTSRSDVNIVATVNPNTNEILLTSIPRDYYVTLPSFLEKDKLTHAGIYGIDESVGAIENLLDIKINYYVKVNFTSLIKIVDTLDGITVNSKYDFTSEDGYKYKKGINNLNGEKALSFVRERKAFSDGDRVRGENQELVLAALIDKILTPSIITKYNDLLKSIKGNFNSNIDDANITKLIKMQLKENNEWKINSISLDGSDASEYTYSYKKNKLYVMLPFKESIDNAKNKINEVLK
ncbi:MAG: LCP family protein [Bacilli bacterium]